MTLAARILGVIVTLCLRMFALLRQQIYKSGRRDTNQSSAKLEFLDSWEFLVDLRNDLS
jgi:hypothetical protein